MILVPVAVPRTAPVFQRVIDPDQRPSVRAALAVETLPPGARAEQLPCQSVESATVVLAGRLRAADRTLLPGEVLHHAPGSSHRLAAPRGGAPAALLTVRLAKAARVAKAEPEGPGIPAQRGGSRSPGTARRIAVETVELAAGEAFGPYTEAEADTFLVLLSGTGAHLGPDGREVPLFTGDLVYVRAGEQYGLRAGEGSPAAVVRGRVGAYVGPEQDLEPMQTGLARHHS
ncbi:cupin domain-containing protein [Streptomyces sp. NRRL WC-3742]|uniref:cupin domain-containing protein n=1 Tax=Streptomyces sp. NRRL WC-3742 TaxID=1463934 RepID=UPI0004C4BA0E|nr:cupin domain-containing protein [Streptomyces sp. NRRL WC-3742]